MKLISLGQAFDRQHTLLVRVRDGGQTRRNCFAIEQDRASAALAFAATVFRARELEVLPQDVEQGTLRVAVNRSRPSVDSQRDRHGLACEGTIAPPVP
jgi:hypothetical protein